MSTRQRYMPITANFCYLYKKQYYSGLFDLKISSIYVVQPLYKLISCNLVFLSTGCIITLL